MSKRILLTRLLAAALALVPIGASADSLNFGNGFAIAGSAGSATINQTVPDPACKTANYSVAAADMAGALNLCGSGATLTIPAVSSTILQPGMTFSVAITGSGPWTLTNSSGLTLSGLNSTSLVSGLSGSFVANADGTHLDFFAGLQPPTSAVIGGVKTQSCSAGNHISAIGTDGSVTCSVDGVAGQYPGTNTNDAATAGNIGEYVSGSVASASAVSLVTGTPKDVTTISLTAGDWNIFGDICFTGGTTTTVTILQGAVTGVANNLGTELGISSVYGYGQTIFSALVNPCFPLVPTRLSIAATTTMHLVASAAFTTSTASAFGQIAARRAR